MSTVDEVAATLAAVTSSETSLLFAHSEIRHGLSNAGIPLVNMDQLNIPTLANRSSPPDGGV